MSDENQTKNSGDVPADAGTPRYQHEYPTRVVPMEKNIHGKPTFGSYLTPKGYMVRSEAQLPPHLPGVIIFVHGVNSEGEWYDAAEKALCDGLNERLNRKDLVPNTYTDLDDNVPARRVPRRIKSLGRSPVIRFYWGYRAPDGEEKNWQIPLKNERGTDFWNQKGAEQPGPWYWGGGPFANGTNNLQQLWSKEGTKEHVAGFFDVQLFNPEWDRELHDCPPRDYFAHAAARLASLVDEVRNEHPDDTVTIMSHSQGTMIALAATTLCKQRAPDAVVVMNSPFAFDDKITDYVTCGNTRPTERARVHTFKAIAERIANDKKLLGPDDLKRLHVGATADMNFWKPDVTLPNNVPERDNHGRLYVYFCPHDRVMGSKPLQSIGWQGINDKLLAELPDTVKQRMLARATACGDESGVKKFGKMPPIPDPMKEPVRPVEPRIEPPRSPNDFWNGNKKALGAQLWVVPNENQTVNVNAERVPNPITAEEMSQPVRYLRDRTPVYFDQSPQTVRPWGAINPDDGRYVESDFPYFASIYQRQRYEERADVYANSGRSRTLESESELQNRIATYRPMPTNHSTLPQHQEFMRRVAAYDLPIGFCDSYESPEFWGKLIHKADWTHYGEDPYFMSGALEVPQQPHKIDGETVSEEVSKADAQRRMWSGA